MSKIKLVVSDCDGTLVTPDKQLTVATRAAVARLHAAGIGFTITSSRPSFGMRMFIAPLGIQLPIGGFNGSAIIQPDGTPIAQHLIPRQAAEASIAFLRSEGIDVWVFTPTEWLILRADGEYVAHEQKTIDHAPLVVDDFTQHVGDACKIVGASRDFDKLARCEDRLRTALGAGAHAARSQTYYLDVTPPNQDKGNFVDFIAARVGVAEGAIATLGDMPNDVPMFRRSGLSFAMGNAPDPVKAQSTHVTDTNRDDGFAKAIEKILAHR
jgi:Cof subfamily protein (haloacid dehalogenase superfamily)